MTSTLEAQNISFSYGPSQQILKHVSLTVSSHERVALSAPSGTGKTTLAGILAGYMRPQSGVVLLDGQPLPQKGISSVQMVWQHPETAVDQRMRLKDTLKEAGALDMRLITGLGIREEWMNRYPHELSGGELQRFCIARALMARPKFLVADEISTMLDALTQAQIWQFLLAETERSNIGLVFISHDPALTKRLATRILPLEKPEQER